MGKLRVDQPATILSRQEYLRPVSKFYVTPYRHIQFRTEVMHLWHTLVDQGPAPLMTLEVPDPLALIWSEMFVRKHFTIHMPREK